MLLFSLLNHEYEAESRANNKILTRIGVLSITIANMPRNIKRLYVFVENQEK